MASKTVKRGEDKDQEEESIVEPAPLGKNKGSSFAPQLLKNCIE